MEKSTLLFVDNRAIAGREDKFVTVTVALAPVLASWTESIFAHEWVTKDGHPKPLDQISDSVREKRVAVEKIMADGEAIERPVLGLGIMDNLEIGAGKDVIITLAAKQIDTIPVHIPKSNMDEFKLFIRDAR